MRPRRRPALLVLGLLGIVLSVTSWGTPTASGTARSSRVERDEPTRYLDQVFDGHVVTANIPFADVIDDGVPRTLLLDLYEPAGDTASDRPIVIWIHGGSFTSGNKGSTQGFPQYLTRRGYVVASIDYRVAEGASWEGTGISDVVGNLEFIHAVWQAYLDAQSAIRYFREHAPTFGIDPERISVAGYSAGAVTALNTGVWPERFNGEGAADDPTHVSGAILSYAGVTATSFPERGEPPMLMLHGSADTTVRYSEAVALCQVAVTRGQECDLRTFAGAHGITEDWDVLHQASVEFLYQHDIAARPFVERASPRQVPAYGGQAIEVVGRNFRGATEVEFGGVDAPFTVVDDERLVTWAPPRTPFLVHLTVTNPQGMSATNLHTTFGFVAPPTSTGTVTGRVLGPGGIPVRGATVEAGWIQEGSFVADRSTITGVDGQYNLLSMPTDPSRAIRFSAPGFVPELHDDLPVGSIADVVGVLDATTSRVDALLQPECGASPPFVDVSVFCGEIAWLVERGVVQGYTDNTYGPELSLTRQTTVAYLYRLAGSPPVPDGAPTFADVPAGSEFEDAIRWSAAEGVVVGYGDGSFRPTRVVSRQVFAILLHRLAGAPADPVPETGGVDAGHPFAVPLSWLEHVGYEAPAWQAGEAVPATFGPTDPVYRRTVAAALYRAAGAGLFTL